MAEMTIRRFGVLSVAKMYGLLMFLFGLIFGVIYGLILIVFGAAISAMGPGRDAAAGGISTVVMGIGVMIGLPLFYGVLGFIMGGLAPMFLKSLRKYSNATVNPVSTSVVMPALNASW